MERKFEAEELTGGEAAGAPQNRGASADGRSGAGSCGSPRAEGTLVVLGGSGFLGVHAVEAALRRRSFARVILAARDPGSARLWPAAVRDPRVGRLRLDLADPEALGELAALAPVAFLNLAALADAGRCERDPEAARRINALAPGALAGLASDLGARLVHASTDLVHGGRPPPPGGFLDGAPAEPLSLYGRTKAEGERLVLERSPESLVVRLPLLFGAARGLFKGATEALGVELLAGRQVMLFEDEFRQPLDVVLCAEALLSLLALPLAGPLNLPGPERVSRAELGRRFLDTRRRAGRPLPPPRFGQRADLGLAGSRPADTWLDGSRAVKLLGPFPPLEVQLRRSSGPIAP